MMLLEVRVEFGMRRDAHINSLYIKSSLDIASWSVPYTLAIWLEIRGQLQHHNIFL